MLVLPILRGEPSRLVIVSGHSMDPTFHTGDLVLAWPSDDYQVGDVAPYRVPEGEPGAGGLVIHRIVGGDGELGFVMQGDNNPAPDIWMPADRGHHRPARSCWCPASASCWHGSASPRCSRRSSPGS